MDWPACPVIAIINVIFGIRAGAVVPFEFAVSVVVKEFPRQRLAILIERLFGFNPAHRVKVRLHGPASGSLLLIELSARVVAEIIGDWRIANRRSFRRGRITDLPRHETAPVKRKIIRRAAGPNRTPEQSKGEVGPAARKRGDVGVVKVVRGNRRAAV